MTSQSNFLERIIPTVRTGGARNIVELASALRIPVETTRYKVKGMLKRGLGVYASVDYSKFGLVNTEGFLLVGRKARENEKKLFHALAESCYLSSVNKVLLGKGYTFSFVTPNPSNLQRLFRVLTEEEIILSSKLKVAPIKKSHMIQPAYFQLKRGVWSIDWGKIRKDTKLEEAQKTRAEPHFDELDLKIAKTLEQDALVKLSDIAKSMKTTLNNIFYHFHKHILGEGIVDEFVIRWNGSSRQEHVFAEFVFEDLSMSEEKVARHTIRKLPFLWSDSQNRDTGFYVGKAMIPTSEYLETLSYLSNSLGDLSTKLKIELIEPKSREVFPLPTHLFKDKGWEFDAEKSASMVASKLKK